MSPKNPPQDNLPLNLILIVLFTVAGSIGLSLQFPRQPSVLDQAPKSDLQKIITPNAFFNTEVNLQPQEVYVIVPYQFENPLLIWLMLPTIAGHPNIIRLVAHPQLQDLDWPLVQNEYYTLFQRTKNYASIEAFLANPPPENQIVMDPILHQTSSFAHLTDQEITETIDLDRFNYILTTYKPPLPSDSGGPPFYQTLVDASIAVKESGNTLQWLLQAPNASEENPYYLGTIHVQYRQ